ncbi:MAG: LysR family transcriptional regulator [Pseudonocardiales bacterium]|nr:MAG: LysR family transcriptional regulator [Pseudonocardiales bacterium]
METRHLEFFAAVADELSFTRAADRVRAVQSTVSAGITALERELRTQLFTRSTRRVELTPAGRELLPEARAALAAIQRMREGGAQAEAGLRGRLRVGLLTNLEWLDLPDLLGAFHRAHPGIELSLGTSPKGSTGMAEDVRRGRLDVALCGLPAADLTDLHLRRLRSQPFVAVLPVGHPRASDQPVAIADLLDEQFVDQPPGFGTRVVLDRWLEQSGLRRTVSTEVPDMSTVPAYVRAGLGIAAIPEGAVVDPTDLICRPLVPELLWNLHAIARPADRSPAADLLIDLLVDRAAGPPSETRHAAARPVRS